MPNKIQEYCRKTRQEVPTGIGAICRCIYQSLACKYRYVIENLEDIVGKQFEKVIIVGGGSNISLLNQITASVTKKEVIIGAKEASVLGNALVLMYEAGDIASIEEGKRLIKQLTGKKKYLPLPDRDLDCHYQRFCEIIER